MVVLSFRKYLYWSFGLHCTAFLILTVSPFLPKHSFRQEKIVWVTLPRGAANQWGTPVKKSEGLPKTTIQEQKKALESPPAGEKKPQWTYKPPEAARKPPAPAPPKRPGHPDSRIEEALARAQKQVAMKKAEPEAAQVPETRPGGFTYGTATGPYISPEDPEYVMYQAKIRQRIMNEWIMPLKLADEALGLICKIVVHINSQGDVMETEWDQKSGNPSFDLSAMRAIEKASPLDIPPDRLKYEVFNEGFTVEFKPQMQQNAP